MEENLTDKSVKDFIKVLSSSAPAPGGGSVAALSGALGAALLSMVSNLTIGKKNYEDVQQEIVDLLAESERLRGGLTNLLEADALAYSSLALTMKLPRDTNDQKTARAKAMDKALKAAVDVPMRVAEACVSVMHLCRPVAEKGNINAVSDIGVAVLLAEAGLRSAALNVLTNFNWIKDEAFVNDNREKLDVLLSGKPELRDEIYDVVVGKLNG